MKVVKGKVGKITQLDNYDLLLRAEILEQDNRVVERRYDLVVLSQGLAPAWHPAAYIGIEEAADHFVETPHAKISPSHTSLPGVFAAGVACGPKDIPDAIVEAGEAAMAAANYLKRFRWRSRVPAGAMA